LATAVNAAPIAIDWTVIGNPGNLSDPLTGFGAVDRAYRIGTTEVTNSQYSAFLNAKATSDPLALYNTNMGSAAAFGGITRSGVSGSYSYATIAGRGDKPVNFVDWYDAIRFVNWLNNGQGNGSTETGAYTLVGGTAVPSSPSSIKRNAGAIVFLPNENEWYKAAYHANDGATSDYYLYPTASDNAPTAEVPPGGVNSANYNYVSMDLTDAGAYAGTTSAYGALDMGGNANEWNETLMGGSFRGLRGGSFAGNSFALLSSSGDPGFDPTTEGGFYGFRVASLTDVNRRVGDYNGNGAVDAADYTVWRDTLGSTSDLRADGNQNGIIDDGDYTVWVNHYGEHFGAGARDPAGVPEPATIALAVVAVVLLAAGRAGQRRSDENRTLQESCR
jgi:formylglycine-generating enzyme required for sulfatase activity